MFAVFAGRHEYDGLLPDWSAEGIASEIRRLHTFRDRALAVPEASLDEDARFERDNFVARMDRDLFWLETAEAPFTNPAFYLDWMLDNLDPGPYLTRDYAPLPRACARTRSTRWPSRRQRTRSARISARRSRCRSSSAGSPRLQGSRTFLRKTLLPRSHRWLTRPFNRSSRTPIATPPRPCASSPRGSSRSAQALPAISRSVRTGSPKCCTRPSA